MSNPLNINVFGTNYDNIEGICVSGTDNNTYTYIVPTGTITITENTIDNTIDITEYAAAYVEVINIPDAEDYEYGNSSCIVGVAKVGTAYVGIEEE